MARRTKIICTLGPAVDGEEELRALLDAGMNVARLNFSHGSHEEHARRIERVKRLRAETGIPCAIMLDTKGPEIRPGLLAGGKPITLSAGQTLILTSDEAADGSDGRVFQSCAALAGSLSLGQRLLLDDGLIELTVTRFDGDDIECMVANDGVLGQRKSINVPGAQLPLPAVTDQDRFDLLFGIQQGVDVVAASFVRDGAGVREIKRFLADNGGEGIAVIAKIEAAGALDNIGDIVREADGLAKSSRNAYLSAEERQAALVLSRAVFAGKEAVEAGERDAAVLKALMSGIIEAEPLARIDYVEVVDGATMQPTDAIGAMALIAMAVYIGNTRLIDNFIFEEGN